MFNKKVTPRQARRIEALEGRIERLTAENRKLAEENKALETELEMCRKKMAGAEEAESEFKGAAEDARKARSEYMEAYEEMKLIQRNYTSEMNRLIKQMRKHGAIVIR